MDAASSTAQYFSELIEFVKDFSLDVIIIGALFAFLFVFALYFGKGRIISLILALYVTRLIFEHFPYTEALLLFGNATEVKLLLSNAILFFLFLIVSTLIIDRVTCAEFYTGPITEWYETAVLSASGVVLLIAFSYHVLPVVSIHDFASPVDNLFASTNLFFWWLIVPLIGIFVAARK